MRFAIVGCGVIGPLHARVLASLGDRAQLVAVVDVDAARAGALAEACGAEPLTSLDAALQRPDIDAVAVCTPSGLHVDVASQALRAGKHVVVEKPLDVTMAAATRLLEAQRGSDRKITVISQHRFDPASTIVRAAVEDGRFGTITSGLTSIALWRSQRYYDSGDWRGTWAMDGGGALMNQGVHQIDLLVWMLGRPVEINATTALLAHEGIEVEDTGVATIRFESGALGVVHGTTAAYPGISNRVQIHGSRGSAVLDDDRLAYFHAAEPGLEAPDYGAGTSSDQTAAVLGQRSDDPGANVDAHGRQYVDFLDAVENDRDPLVTVAGAAQTLAVVTGIYRSAREGRAVRIEPLPT